MCPTCGCSLVRLGINPDEAASYEYEGRKLLFCCQACADLFVERPEQYLDKSETGSSAQPAWLRSPSIWQSPSPMKVSRSISVAALAAWTSSASGLTSY